MRVLVVEDDPTMRELLVKVLRLEGFTVTEAADGGADAIRLLASGSVDLLVSDVRMGPNDGLALTALAKAASPRTKVLLMTAYGGRAEERKARTLGAERAAWPLTACAGYPKTVAGNRVRGRRETRPCGGSPRAKRSVWRRE